MLGRFDKSAYDRRTTVKLGRVKGSVAFKKNLEPKRNKGTWTIRRAEGLDNTAEIVLSCPRCGWVGSFLDGIGAVFKYVDAVGNVAGPLICNHPECGMKCIPYLEGWNPRNDWKT